MDRSVSIFLTWTYKFQSFETYLTLRTSFYRDNNTSIPARECGESGERLTMDNLNCPTTERRADSWRLIGTVFSPPAFEGISIIIRGFSEAPSPLSLSRGLLSLKSTADCRVGAMGNEATPTMRLFLSRGLTGANDSRHSSVDRANRLP